MAELTFTDEDGITATIEVEISGTGRVINPDDTDMKEEG